MNDMINIIHNDVENVLNNYMENLVQSCKSENMKSSPNGDILHYYYKQIMEFEKIQYAVMSKINKHVKLICTHCNKTFQHLDKCKDCNNSFCREYLRDITDPYCRATGDYICKKCDRSDTPEQCDNFVDKNSIEYFVDSDCSRNDAIRGINNYCGNDQEKKRDMFLRIRSVGFLRCLNPNCKKPSENRGEVYYSPQHIVNCVNCK